MGQRKGDRAPMVSGILLIPQKADYRLAQKANRARLTAPWPYPLHPDHSRLGRLRTLPQSAISSTTKLRPSFGAIFKIFRFRSTSSLPPTHRRNKQLFGTASPTGT